jgi:hypothetical protein
MFSLNVTIGLHTCLCLHITTIMFTLLYTQVCTRVYTHDYTYVYTHVYTEENENVLTDMLLCNLLHTFVLVIFATEVFHLPWYNATVNKE